MIVAACAVNRHSEQALTYRSNHFVQFILPSLSHGRFVTTNLPRQIRGTGDQKTECRILRDRVTDDLFKDELIVRLVCIQGVNHPVSIVPGIGRGAFVSKPTVSAQRITSSQCCAQRSPYRGDCKSRSTTDSNALSSSRESRTNSVTSSQAGGRPFRSSAARRINVCLFAKGRGLQLALAQLTIDEGVDRILAPALWSIMNIRRHDGLSWLQ